jgi:glycerophosphoryl diester phosphodiesterase
MKNGSSLEPPNKVLVVAHRGASAYKYENTIESFEEAIAQKADMVEFDLRLTSDSKIILHHDPYILSIKGKKALIAKTSFHDLQTMAKDTGFELATFEDVLDHFGHRIKMNIEIKMNGFEETVLAQLRKYKIDNDPVISSFKKSVVNKFRQLDKNIKLGYIMGRSPANLLNIKRNPALRKFINEKIITSVHLHKDIARKSNIKKLTAEGLSVYIWTVDDEDDYMKFINYGVAGIITNKPDRLREIVEKRGAANH